MSAWCWCPRWRAAGDPALSRWLLLSLELEVSRQHLRQLDRVAEVGAQ